jgi:hypothetical protein
MLQSEKMFDGMSIYVCTDLLPFFINTILPQLVNTFVLVSGDSDTTVPYEIITTEQYNHLISHNLLIKWFVQNTTVQDCNKIVQMPIGIDYHTILSNPYHYWKTPGENHLPESQEKILIDIISSASQFFERHIKIYVNFSMSNDRFGQRITAFQQIPLDLMVINQNFTPRTQTWNNITKYAFALSPFGNGMDCHRTWEILCLGAIPIVCAPQFKQLFQDLPVLNVNKWSDITEKLLHKTISDFSKKSFHYEKLKLSYWTQLFNSHKNSSN